MSHRLLLISSALFLAACSAGPQVTTIQTLSETADAPYSNVLVISLFKSFDGRRYLEKEIVKQLEAKGVNAVASTSLMDTRTPVTRETFLAMVDDLDSDAVLVTQLVTYESEAKMKTMRPQTSYNVRPTYYYNVWNVHQTEYLEPEGLQLKHIFVLATQLFSVRDLEPVWTIESRTKIKQAHDKRGDLSVIEDEARAITSRLARDGLLAR